MAIHQVFAFTYLVAILVILIYQVFEKRNRKGSIFNLILALSASCVSFIYFQFLKPSLNVTSVEGVIQIIQKRCNVPALQNMIAAEYFSSIVDQINTFVIPNLKTRLLNGLVTILLISPLIVLFILIWKRVLKNTPDKTNKYIIYIMILAPICALPAFALTIDWGRWFASIFIVQFSFLFYLVYTGFLPIIHTLKELQVYIINKKYMLLMLIVYVASLGKFEAAAILNISTKITSYLTKIITIVF